MMHTRRTSPAAGALALLITILPASAALASETEAAAKLERAIAAVEKSPAEAKKLLDELVEELPALPDYVLYYRALATRESDPLAAARDLEAVLDEHQPTPLVARAAAVLAEVRAAAGSPDMAAALADRYARKEPAQVAQARLCAAAGKALADIDPVRAESYLQCARERAPGSSWGEAARTTLERLRGDGALKPPADAAGLYREATLLGREGRYEKQKKALFDFLAKFPFDGKALDASMAYGRALGKTEDRQAAARYYQGQGDRTGSLQLKARYYYEAGNQLWNANDDENALRLFQRVGDLKSGIDQERKAMYALGRIHEAAKRYPEAIEAYGKAAGRARGSEQAERRWRQGWAAYLARRDREAVAAFASASAAAAEANSAEWQAASWFWRARTLERMMQPDQAKELYERVLTRFPDGYYAHIVEQQLDRKPPPKKVQALPTTDRNALGVGARRVFARASTLVRAGLAAEVSTDLGLRIGSLPADDSRSLLPALVGIDAYGHAFRVAIRLHGKGMLSDGQLLPYSFPHAYADLVNAEAKRHGLDPYVIFALMRQESAFDASAVSRADAFGLMQLLVPTAERVAKAAGIDGEITRERLFDPALNIRLGSAYLASLKERFGGSDVLALAAYNAGENAADRWAKLGNDDPAAAVEAITYGETRDYVKKVLRNRRNYARIYGS